MLDVSFIRKNPEIIRVMLKNRNYPEELLDRFLEKDNEWRTLVDIVNQQRKTRNDVAHSVSKLDEEMKARVFPEMKKLAENIAKTESRIEELEKDRNEVVLLIPNIPDSTVPVGACYDNNCCVKSYGKERTFDFKIKDHIQIGEDLDIIDFNRVPRSPEAASMC